MTLVTVTANKATSDVLAGVGFSRLDENSPLLLAHLDESGLFGKSPLILGLTVTKINGKDMMWEHPRDAADEIKKASGSISITVEGFVAKVTKGRKTPTGLVLEDTKAGGIVIADIREDSMFATSELKVGMQILSINARPCPKPAWRAIHKLQRSAGRIKVVAVGGYPKNGFQCWWSGNVEPQLSATLPPAPPVVEDVSTDDLLPTLFERVFGIRPQRQTLLTRLTSTYDPKRGILRKNKVAPIMLEGDGNHSRIHKDTKTVRFNKTRSTTIRYDPKGRPCKTLPLHLFYARITTPGSTMDDAASQGSGKSRWT
jgi:hypothetical protein